MESTGYSIYELQRIEKAFEMNTKMSGRDQMFYSDTEITEDKFSGLMAVLDVLFDIEGITGEQTISEYKEMFSSHGMLQ